MKKIKYLLIIVYFQLSGITLNGQNAWTIYNNSNTILSTGTYLSIAIDNTGVIWVGSRYSGVYKFDGTNWTAYSTSNSNISHDFIKDILVDNSNNVWIGTYKGLSKYNGTTFTNYDTLNAGFKGSEVYTLGKDKNGVIWLASMVEPFTHKGITTYNGTTWTNLTGYPSQIQNAEFLEFAFTSSNTAWIASDNGFVKYDGTFTFYPYASTGLWSSSTVAIDASTNIWTGGFDGLLKYDGSSWTYYDNVSDLGLVSNTHFNDIFPDGNYLWIGTSEGLLKFNRNTSAIVANYNSSNSPLEDDCVMEITKDANGYFWMATSIGVVKMDPALLGVNEQDNDCIMNVFPNPATNNVNVVSSQGSEIVITDAEGKVLKELKTSTELTKIDISAISKGMYFLKVKNEKGVTVKKIIKD
jgi:ligand-binding sensor domain-containing protein